MTDKNDFLQYEQDNNNGGNGFNNGGNGDNGGDSKCFGPACPGPTMTITFPTAPAA